jgi:hypothetical protein
LGAEENEVHVRASMSGDVSRALGEAAAAAEEADQALDSLGRTGVKVGGELDRGMTKAKNSTQRARNAAGQFVASANAAGNAAVGAGAKAAAGSTGFNKWAKSAEKASKSTGGLKAMIMLIKWGTLLTGGQAAIAMLASLGAGAVMAVGHMAPLVGVVGALGPALFLMASMMGLMKISGSDLKALLVPLANDFKAMRYEITRAMVPGIQAFSKAIHDGLIPTLRAGFIELGGSFGDAAGHLGAMLAQAHNASQIGVLFHGMNPIIMLLSSSLGHVLLTLINLAVAALPMTTSMAQGLERVTTKLDAWAKRMTDSGKAQAFMMRAWDQMKTDGRILRDLLIGLFNIFKIAGGVARTELGGGMESAAAKFRAWTASAEGSARILKYFQDSVPTLRETGLLILALLRGISRLGSNPDIAELIRKIRTELLPALGALFSKFSQNGGMGDALVDMFTNVALALSKIDMQGLGIIIRAVADLAGAVVWLVANVPGLGTVIGMFLTMWVVAGAGFKVAEKGIKAFGWIKDATTGAKNLSAAQKGLGLVLKGVGPALDTVGTALKAFGVATWAALGPVGVIILVIGALVLAFIWAYNKFDWFREGVWKILYAVRDGFVWLAKAAAAPFIELWDIIKGAYNLIAKGWNMIPTIHVPDWIPLIGGKDFTLPKMPLLAHGGVIEYGTAIVGEQGPEALVKGGRFLGMVGMNGPELRTDLPRGGYVVPNLDTLNRMPGLTARLPASVADAVAGALPSYGALLGRGNAAPGTTVNVNLDSGSADVVDAIHDLAAAVMSRPGPAPVDTDAIVRALRGKGGGPDVSSRYTYSSPRRP